MVAKKLHEDLYILGEIMTVKNRLKNPPLKNINNKKWRGDVSRCNKNVIYDVVLLKSFYIRPVFDPQCGPVKVHCSFELTCCCSGRK